MLLCCSTFGFEYAIFANVLESPKLGYKYARIYYLSKYLKLICFYIHRGLCMVLQLHFIVACFEKPCSRRYVLFQTK